MFVEHKYLRHSLVLLVFIMVAVACNLPTTPEPSFEEVQENPPTAEVAAEPDTDEALPADEMPLTDEEAPDEGPDICFEAICFSYDESIACNVNGEIVPASDGEMWDNYPAYVKFSFDCYPLADTFHEPEIRIYPVADYEARVEMINEIVGDMDALLSSRPPEPENVPFLPMWNAAALFRSKISYVDFQNGSGVRFLTQFGQAAWPINNQDMFYTYQGLTEDGAYYVSAILPASNPILPANGDDAIPAGDQIAFSENFLTYIDDIRGQLNGQTPESFTPNLIFLDEMIGSLRVH